MSSCELTAFITAIANILARELSNGEISLLSSIFVQLGDTLATIVTNNAFIEEYRERKEE